jgi:uncharacterized membrane protein YkgB
LYGVIILTVILQGVIMLLWDIAWGHQVASDIAGVIMLPVIMQGVIKLPVKKMHVANSYCTLVIRLISQLLLITAPEKFDSIKIPKSYR